MEGMIFLGHDLLQTPAHTHRNGRDKHRKCTQLVRNNVALSTPQPREILEKGFTYPRFEGEGGGGAHLRQRLLAILLPSAPQAGSLGWLSFSVGRGMSIQ